MIKEKNEKELDIFCYYTHNHFCGSKDTEEAKEIFQMLFLNFLPFSLQINALAHSYIYHTQMSNSKERTLEDDKTKNSI